MFTDFHAKMPNESDCQSIQWLYFHGNEIEIRVHETIPYGVKFSLDLIFVDFADSPQRAAEIRGFSAKYAKMFSIYLDCRISIKLTDTMLPTLLQTSYSCNVANDWKIKQWIEVGFCACSTARVNELKCVPLAVLWYKAPYSNYDYTGREHDRDPRKFVPSGKVWNPNSWKFVPAIRNAKYGNPRN